MRKIVLSVAVSLDGYIAGPRGEIEWIPMDPAIDWVAFMDRFDVVLMGRKTFEVAAAQEGGGVFPGLETIVASRTLDAVEHPLVRIVSKDLMTFLADLRNGDGKDIWLMGGGELFRALWEAKLIDIVELGVVPHILGRGIRLLPESKRSSDLELLSTKQYPSGLMLQRYSVGAPSRS